MVISKTPYRISLFGGGTDFPKYYRKYGGCVIGGSINKYCYISVRNLPKFFDHKLRFVWSQIENVKNSKEIIHPSMNAILKHLKINNGYEIHYDGDLPGMSGMGSSSSFSTGVVRSIFKSQNKKINPFQLFKLTKEIEQKVLKEYIGSQDQFWSAFGGFRHIKFNKKSYTSKNLFHSKNINKISSNIILFFTGKKRISSEIEKTKILNLNDKISYYHELKPYVNRCRYIIENNLDVDEIGEMLDQTWELKKKLSSSVSNKFIDELYDEAIKIGATGGKILGSGGGGFILFYANKNIQKRLIKKFSKLEYLDKIDFINKGSEIIFDEK